MTLQEQIRGNSGISDIEYLEEGIVFFKNSTKMKRLSKNLSNKREKLIKKSDMENAKALSALITEIDTIVKKFEAVEQKFKQAKGKEAKGNIKQEYKNLEKEFKKLLKVARKDSTKKALIAVGGLAIVAGVIAAGIFGLQSLETTGVLDNAGANVDARLRKANLINTTQTTGSDGVQEIIGKTGQRVAGSFVYDQIIKSTNKDLVQAATITGATAGGVVGAGVLQKLRKMGQKNKTIADTVAALEDLKSAEIKSGRADDNEGDES